MTTTTTVSTKTYYVESAGGGYISFRGSTKVFAGVGTLLGWSETPPADKIEAARGAVPKIVISMYNETSKRGRSARVYIDPSKLEEAIGATGDASLKGKTIDGFTVRRAYTPRRRVYV